MSIAEIIARLSKAEELIASARKSTKRYLNGDREALDDASVRVKRAIEILKELPL